MHVQCIIYSLIIVLFPVIHVEHVHVKLLVYLICLVVLVYFSLCLSLFPLHYEILYTSCTVLPSCLLSSVLFRIPYRMSDMLQ